jgi:hypothetical protein
LRVNYSKKIIIDEKNKSINLKFTEWIKKIKIDISKILYDKLD